MTKRRRRRRILPSDQVSSVSGRQTSPTESSDDFRITLVHVFLLVLLMFVVGSVLLVLIYVAEASWWAAVAVIIVLTVLMLAVSGAPDLLPRILREIGRILGFRR